MRLCALAWSFILLPLGFCCEGQKSKNDITMEYKSIILPLLQEIHVNVTKEVFGACSPKNRSQEYETVSTQTVVLVVCRHSKTDFCFGEPKMLQKLSDEILESLCGECKTKNEKQQSRQGGSLCESQPHKKKRKLCTLKHWLERIKDLYSQFNST